MSILLAAINSRYNHTNLAIRSINEYVKRHSLYKADAIVSFDEWTIAHYAQDILRGIVTKNPDVVIFSVYIWNTRLVFDVITELKKVSPNIIIGLGGPDVSYRACEVIQRYPQVDVVLQGEGEQTVLELAELYTQCVQNNPYNKKRYLEKIVGVQATTCKTLDEKIHIGECRNPLNMDDLAFPYTDFSEPDYKLYYYESSRGCPFSCSYCLSSIEKKVRFMSLERVYQDLQRFLDANVKIVKFVDRTFNLNAERYLSIWKYIVENHNDYTMFHFEISAEHLDDEALEFLQKIPSGVMQFEIGVQSTNEKTLQEICRPVKLDILSKKIEGIPKTIHSHLDLIAGLPHESLQEFEKSFNFVLALKPDMLQLGFLKILSGTKMESYAKTKDYAWLSNPPHEVLKSPWLSYEDICFLHDVETVLDWYYNSHYFDTTFEYLLKNATNAYEIFSDIAMHFRANGFFDIQHKMQTHFSLLHDYLVEKHKHSLAIIIELLRFDYFYMGKTSVFPDCFILHYDKDAHHAGLINHADMKSTREAYTHSSYEEFEINPYTLEKERTPILFLYGKRAEKKQKTNAVLLNKN